MIGTTLGHYEIASLLGKGGMGEVYQAKDKKLGRDVAIKVLPQEFASDADRVARFQREAKVLASLNHPNIAAIHGLEESDGTNLLVMELVEGETLAELLKRGPLPVENALKLAVQIAEALEAAHDKGIVHRDLKPSNIKITPDGKVKVLDFGLAKAYSGDREEINLSNSPTLSDAATQQGLILGTAAYMSPEQARGKPIDKRADIWAFGAVLFEMLTGHAAFSGKDVTDILAAVIRSEPEWERLPANLHWRLREVLERCLKKELKDRYHDASDVRVDLQKILTDPSGIFAQPITGAIRERRLRRMLPSAGLAVILMTLAGVVVWKLKPAPPPEAKRIMRFTYELPEGQQFRRIQSGGFSAPLAVSNDGSRFVYGTTDGLYLRSVDALDARLLPGTDRNSYEPGFSPDGQWICYWSASDRKIKKLAVSGGAPVALCDTGITFVGLQWNRDNTIVYSDPLNGGIKRISADGGTPESLVAAVLAQTVTGGWVPVAPRLLPDGKNLLFTSALTPSRADMQIVVQSLESGDRKVLLKPGGYAYYLPTGHLLYELGDEITGNLLAVPLNLEKLEVAGGPVPILERVVNYAVSDSGTWIYVLQPPAAAEAKGQAGPGRTLVWVDRKGRETPIQTPPRMYKYPRISPDGTKLALTFTTDGNQDIWVWDFVRETLSRLTFDKAPDLTALWTPDGRRIAFFSSREEALLRSGVGGVFWKAADGTGSAEYLVSAKERFVVPYSFSKDGDSILTAEWNIAEAQTNPTSAPFDIGIFSMKGDHAQKLLLQGKYMETQPRVSPDGRSIAYCSDESGTREIYVRPFPEIDKGRWQVSTNGGHTPLWSPDGRELFYLTGNTDAVMAVGVETDPAFRAGKPQLLFRGKYVGPLPDDGVPWDISPDGRRFLMMKEPEIKPDSSPAAETAAAGPRKINIVVNWFEELQQRAPAKQ
jgi:serine/threonine-protein kinase